MPHGLHHPLLSLSQHFLLFLLVWRWLGKTDIHIGAAQIRLVERVHGSHSHLPVLEMNESIVLDLLDPVNFAMLFKDFAQLLLGDGGCEIAHIKNFHLDFRKKEGAWKKKWFTLPVLHYLWHGLLIWLFLRIGPINDDITAPNFDTTRLQPPFGQAGCFVRLVFQEAEPTILLVVVRGAIDDDFLQPRCNEGLLIKNQSNQGQLHSGKG